MPLPKRVFFSTTTLSLARAMSFEKRCVTLVTWATIALAIWGVVSSKLKTTLTLSPAMSLLLKSSGM